jgi:hypothetical protein
MVFATIFIGFCGFVAGVMVTSVLFTPQAMRMWELCELEATYGVDIHWVRETLQWNEFQKTKARNAAGGMINRYPAVNIDNCFKVKIRDVGNNTNKTSKESKQAEHDSEPAEDSEPTEQAEEAVEAVDSEPTEQAVEAVDVLKNAEAKSTTVAQVSAGDQSA